MGYILILFCDFQLGIKSDIFTLIHLQFQFFSITMFQIQLKCDCVETHVLNIRERIILYWLKCVIYNRNIKHQEVWSVRYFICSVHVYYTALVDQCSMFNSGMAMRLQVFKCQQWTTIRLTNLSSQQIKDYKYTANWKVLW